MNILVIGERPNDCERVIRIVQPVYRNAAFIVVNTAHDLADALEQEELALALTDYGISEIAGPALIQMMRESHPALCIILVVDAIDPLVAQTLLQEGISDVVLKEQIYRLPNAIRATLRAAPGTVKRSNPPIEDLKAALQHEEQFRALFEDAPIGISIARAGVTVSVNQAYMRMFGYASEAQVLGKPLLQNIAPRERGRIAERVVQREQGVAVPNAYETIGLRPDGTEFPFHVEVARVSFMDGPVSVAFCTDITARKVAEDRLRFLTEASALFATSLDYETTLARVAQLVVPHLADWCSVDMLADDGSLQRVAVAHVDPAKVDLVREGQRRYPPDPTRSHPTLRVLQSGQSELMVDIPESLLVHVAQDATHLEMMRALGFRSALYVPLIVRGRVVGAITLIYAESGRQYASHDMPFVEELARRAALAIDNASLYRLAQEQRERLQVTLGSIGDGVIATDTAGRVTLLNGVAQSLTGWSETEAIGRPLDEVFAIVDEQTGERAESPVVQVLREGTIVSAVNQTILIAKDGRTTPIDHSGAPIRADDGQWLGVVMVFHDVSERRHAQAVLREQEALFRSMADSAPVFIWLADKEKRCTFLNQSWLSYTGSTLERELGSGWSRSIHPDDHARSFEIYTTSFDERQPFSMEYRLRRADGIYRWFIDRGLPRWTAEGDFVGYIGSCVDITERKDAEERQRFLAEASPVLSASLDYNATLTQVARLFVPQIADYCILYLIDNDGYCRQVAAAHCDSSKQALVEALAPLYKPGMPGTGSPTQRVLETGRGLVEMYASTIAVAPVLTDPEVLRIYRELNPVSYMIVPLIARGQVTGAMTLAAAESGRHYTTDDLAFATDLASRCALAIDNARLYAEARHAITLRDRFVSIASHELKTPLTAMLGYTRLLQQRNKREQLLKERDARALEVIVKQGERLDRLVNLLLDLSRIETGQLRIDPVTVDLRGVVQQLVEEFQPTFTNHHIVFEGSEMPLVVLADEGRIEQVIQNIISNAIKYSPYGGTVTVTLEQRDQQALVVVRDMGIGIPAEALPRLGERFFRAKNVDPQHISGTGIGLYVSREIMQLHGGAIEIESAEGTGTTVTVSLPIHEPEADQSNQ